MGTIRAGDEATLAFQTPQALIEGRWVSAFSGFMADDQGQLHAPPAAGVITPPAPPPQLGGFRPTVPPPPKPSWSQIDGYYVFSALAQLEVVGSATLEVPLDVFGSIRFDLGPGHHFDWLVEGTSVCSFNDGLLAIEGSMALALTSPGYAAVNLDLEFVVIDADRIEWFAKKTSRPGAPQPEADFSIPAIVARGRMNRIAQQ